jgi:hypothetical protein
MIAMPEAPTKPPATYLILKMWVVRRTGTLVVKGHAGSMKEFPLPYSAVRNIRPCPGTLWDRGYHYFECALWLVEKLCLWECARAARDEGVQL